jgi:hypothetical protein
MLECRIRKKPAATTAICAAAAVMKYAKTLLRSDLACAICVEYTTRPRA